MSDEQQRAHFDAFADLLECISRLFWRDGLAGNRLGITLDDDTLMPAQEVKSAKPIDNLFNAAADGAARKKDP